MCSILMAISNMEFTAYLVVLFNYSFTRANLNASGAPFFLGLEFVI
jgi:hypothetical protein